MYCDCDQVSERHWARSRRHTERHLGGIGFDLMQSTPHTTSRAWAAAAPPSVIGGRGSDFRTPDRIAVIDIGTARQFTAQRAGMAFEARAEVAEAEQGFVDPVRGRLGQDAVRVTRLASIGLEAD